jgi:hypothetical protein
MIPLARILFFGLLVLWAVALVHVFGIIGHK